tara:strand:- start:39768 stop:40286 length:519 start_codon:yes stop_codon:yes gene_type:complete
MAGELLGDVLQKVGAPFLKKIVEGSLPPPFNQLGGYAVDVLAERLGTEPTEDAIVARYQAEPKVVGPIISEVEASPELILAGVEQQKLTNTLLLAEMKEPLWTWAWRPLGMYGLGVLWFWNVIALHAFNAWLKIALPPTDPFVLMQLSGLYMALYMGGHTFKDFATKKWGKA